MSWPMHSRRRRGSITSKLGCYPVTTDIEAQRNASFQAKAIRAAVAVQHAVLKNRSNIPVESSPTRPQTKATSSLQDSPSPAHTSHLSSIEHRMAERRERAVRKLAEEEARRRTLYAHHLESVNNCNLLESSEVDEYESVLRHIQELEALDLTRMLREDALMLGRKGYCLMQLGKIRNDMSLLVASVATLSHYVTHGGSNTDKARWMIELSTREILTRLILEFNQADFEAFDRGMLLEQAMQADQTGSVRETADRMISDQLHALEGKQLVSTAEIKGLQRALHIIRGEENEEVDPVHSSYPSSRSPSCEVVWDEADLY